MENEYLKLPIYIISCKFGYYLSNVLKYILEKEKYKVIIEDTLDIEKENLHIILFSQKNYHLRHRPYLLFFILPL